MLMWRFKIIIRTMVSFCSLCSQWGEQDLSWRHFRIDKSPAGVLRVAFLGSLSPLAIKGAHSVGILRQSWPWRTASVLHKSRVWEGKGSSDKTLSDWESYFYNKPCMASKHTNRTPSVLKFSYPWEKIKTLAYCKNSHLFGELFVTYLAQLPQLLKTI